MGSNETRLGLSQQQVYNAAGVGIGIVMLATAAVALRARALLPRRLALLSLVVGIAFLTPLSRFLLGSSVLLLAAVSVQLIMAPVPDAASTAA